MSFSADNNILLVIFGEEPSLEFLYGSEANKK